MGLILVIMVIGQWGKGLSRPLWPKPPAESINYYFDPYPPDEILPTPLPNEWSCWGCCCLFPIGGMFMERAYREKAEEQARRFFSICFASGLGSVYGKESAKTSTGIGLPSEYYLSEFYWVQFIQVRCDYSFSSWTLGGGLSYLWGKEDNRVSIFRTSQGEVIGGDWDISAFTPTLIARFNRKNMFFEGGLEVYFAKGTNHSFIRKGPYPSEFEPIVIKTKGIGPGVSIGTGLSPKLNSNFGLDLSVLGRLAMVWNPDFWSDKQVEIERYENYYHSFTGLYLKVGIRYLTPLRGAK